MGPDTSVLRRKAAEWRTRQNGLVIATDRTETAPFGVTESRRRLCPTSPDSVGGPPTQEASASDAERSRSFEDP